MNNAVKNPVYRKRLLTHRIGITLSVCAMGIGLAFLAWILFTLLYNGFGDLSTTLFTADTPAPGTPGGGLRNAILGSVMMVGLSALVSTPIGILAGIYLAEYGENNKFAQITRFVTDIEGRALPRDFKTEAMYELIRRRWAELDEAITEREWFDPWVFELEDEASPSEVVYPWVAGFAAAALAYLPARRTYWD